ncbi:hypothetical protein SAMN05192574_10688 [Mucilaginibacter gossypiicola]|uniref:Uncharacterized protein n=1 Tax=Mucilaginibacter gossypiicola TaxID=551995 RepID=A0A1H8MUR9_9SPHI|nr:hypothetical protein [Mucilaginibacter gossypiicola]SEO20956.1 hypothetical protein SAMN05192574_10688 [Mucilaginibacter gossypiicola]
MKKLLLILILTSASLFVKAQQINRFNPDTIRTIVIDSLVDIRSHKLNAQDFIDAVLADTGFYKAFQNMKKFGFTAENRIFTYDNKNKVSGRIYRKILHSNAAGKHKIEYIAKKDSGDVYKKNGKYQLYTVEMFDFIFMNAYNSDFTKGYALPGSGGKNESYKSKLKALIFTPGRKINGIPFISSKTEIFGDDMRQYYYYEFARGKYLDTIPVYRFKVRCKPSTSDSDTMIKEMTTIFDERTFQILGRYIDMKFSNMFFDFNVQMNIELNNFDGEPLPTKITYQGNWNIPFHKEERASFLIVHKDYKKE